MGGDQLPLSDCPVRSEGHQGTRFYVVACSGFQMFVSCGL